VTGRKERNRNEMRVLVACEESQEVCKSFRERGHESYSCDIQEPSGGHPEWHILGDCLPILGGCCEVQTMDGISHVIPDKWDLLIAHPPCTDLAVSGARWFAEKQKDGRQQKSIVFFMQLALASCGRVAVENPISIMSNAWRKPDQIIQPYQFGEHARKATCLWLKNLPKLTPTKIVDGGDIRIGGYSTGAHADGKDENGKWLRFGDPKLSRLRARTFPGIARAMAEQWGTL